MITHWICSALHYKKMIAVRWPIMLISHCNTSQSWRDTYCSTEKECLEASVIRGLGYCMDQLIYIYIPHYKKRSRNICSYSYAKIIINKKCRHKVLSGVKHTAISTRKTWIYTVTVARLDSGVQAYIHIYFALQIHLF